MFFLIVMCSDTFLLHSHRTSQFCCSKESKYFFKKLNFGAGPVVLYCSLWHLVHSQGLAHLNACCCTVKLVVSTLNIKLTEVFEVVLTSVHSCHCSNALGQLEEEADSRTLSFV